MRVRGRDGEGGMEREGWSCLALKAFSSPELPETGNGRLLLGPTQSRVEAPGEPVSCDMTCQHLASVIDHRWVSIDNQPATREPVRGCTLTYLQYIHVSVTQVGNSSNAVDIVVRSWGSITSRVVDSWLSIN